MSLLKLPEIRADAGMTGVQFDMRTDAVERWQPDVRAVTPEPSQSAPITS